MKRIFTFGLILLISNISFADGVKVTEGNTKGCKGLGLSKTIGFYLADETQSNQFTKALSWQGKTMYLEKDPRLTRSDIEYIGLPVASAGTEKSFALTFTKTGLKRVNKITSKNMNKFLVIAVDGQMVFSAQIKTEIGQEVQITDGTQTDGVSLFSKMCPNPNIF